MAESLEELEARMTALRGAVRGALRARDKAALARSRSELRAAEAAWHTVLGVAPDTHPAAPDPAQAVPIREQAVPVREQVHRALALLGAPASPKLISSVHEAFFHGPLVVPQLAALRRDEERAALAQGSAGAVAQARRYHICAALTHDRLAPARGLLALSTWPLERRVLGPLGPRTDFLTHAGRLAEHAERLRVSGCAPSESGGRLLRRFALNIPGAHEDEHEEPEPGRIIAAVRTEAAMHGAADDRQRTETAARARAQLSSAQQLFGVATLGVVRRGTEA
ncbi:hypothetical protein LHJ74_19975 [Streptomyces sp. N2-109]|uniref:Uncharacterized protein n=1 Tax=Streptomyces gossypii TaxID=2883101 RepID=A0ABT2JW70_9ACTN|nr:hypothetical protein [Streptomyces gossypii]MCT2592154.1 hypothetical protein [Streptomyces gossypii]